MNVTEYEETRRKLIQMIKERALFFQLVKLSSGKKSNFYIDAKQVTLSAEGSYLVAKLILHLIKKDNVEAIGGPTIGADPIVGAVIQLGYLNNLPLKGFIVRKNPKGHGMQRYVEGPPLKEGTRVAVIDDVVTTGRSTLKAVRVMKEMGCEVVKVIALVDRKEGAEELLKDNGFILTSLLTRDDLKISE